MSDFSLDINSSLERAYRTVPILRPVFWSGIRELLETSRKSYNEKQKDTGFVNLPKHTGNGKGIVNDLSISALERSIQYLFSRLENYDSRKRYIAEAFSYKKAHRLEFGNSCDYYRCSELGSQLGFGVCDLPDYLQTNYSNFLSYLIDESTASVFQICYSEIFDLFSTEWDEKKAKLLENSNNGFVSLLDNCENTRLLNPEFNFSLGEKGPNIGGKSNASGYVANDKGFVVDDNVRDNYLILSDLIPNVENSELNTEKFYSIQKMCLSSFNLRIRLIQELSSSSVPPEYKEEVVSFWRLLTLFVGTNLKSGYSTRQMISNSIRTLEISMVDRVLHLNSNIVMNKYASGNGSGMMFISLKNFISITRKLYLADDKHLQVINSQFSFPSEQGHFWFLAFWAFRIGSGQILWDMSAKYVDIPHNFSLVCKCLAAILLSTSSSLLMSQSNEDQQTVEENWIKQCVQFDFNKDLFSSKEYRELNSLFYSGSGQDLDGKEQVYYQILFSIINTSTNPLNIMRLLPNATLEDYVWYQFHIILKTNDDNGSARELCTIFNKIKAQAEFVNGKNLYYLSEQHDESKGRTQGIISEYNKLQDDKPVKGHTNLELARLFCYTLHFSEAVVWIYNNHPQLRTTLLQWVLYLAISGLIPLWKEGEKGMVGEKVIGTTETRTKTRERGIEISDTQLLAHFSGTIEEESHTSLFEILISSIKNFSVPFPFISKLARLYPQAMRSQILEEYVEYSMLHDIVEDDYSDSVSFHSYMESGRPFSKFESLENIKNGDYSDICEEMNTIIAKLARNRGHYITSILFFMEANLTEEVLDTIFDCLKLPVCYSFTTLNTKQQLFFDKLQTILSKVINDPKYQQTLNSQSKLDSIKKLNEIVYTFVLIQKGFYRSAKEYIESKNFIPKSDSGINSGNILYLPKIIEGYVVSLSELCRNNESGTNGIPDDVHYAIFKNYHIITSLVNSLISLHCIQTATADKINKLLREMLILVSADQLALANHH
ncbi:hypothetical protein FG386_000705 [Cryptosporidium ryanae]|uniref:uncharacterized protein n=1 Tax=Cryptosporidium ryanae TaxID=515981 RepID=UPI003519D880|nr:hypothetical protein FG386_000705 [Cryptosporidium ryanae]